MAVQRLRRWLIDSGRLLGTVRATVSADEGPDIGVDVVYQISPGPYVEVRFEGVKRKEEKKLRRAGLDYREFVAVQTHASLNVCLGALDWPRLFALSTRNSLRYDQALFREGDALLFGPETRGLPAEVLSSLPPERRLRLPMREGNRSLNLSNAAAVVVYEAWRQLGFDGGA